MNTRREKPMMPESWMSGMVRCVDRDGGLDLVQTGPWAELIVFLICFPPPLLFGLWHWKVVPVGMLWAMGVALYGMGAVILVRAWHWRRVGAVLSFDAARGEISIPRMGVVIPAGEVSSLRMGSVRCADGEGGEVGAKTLEYLPEPGGKAVVVYISSDRKFVGEWMRFLGAIRGRDG